MMRLVYLLVAMGLVSVLLGPERGLAEGQDSPSRGVVYMRKSSKFVVPLRKDTYHGYRSPLPREIHRQAFLIAARDQLGLTTRDAYLGDWMPTEGDNAPFEMVIFYSRPTTLKVLRGFNSAKTTLHKHEPTITHMPTEDILGSQFSNMVDHRRWLIDAEVLSRGGYLETLKKSGFQGAAHKQEADGEIPEEIDELLGQMTFMTQFHAIRRLHELIRSEGESPARLGALVRGYANLGVLTQFYWHPVHKVFKARALLYAQRLLARDERSPQALWHRAYAFGMVGLHSCALDDLQAAEKIVVEMKESERPAQPDWVELIDAHCRFDSKRLKDGVDDPRYTELAILLRYLTTKMGGEKTLKVAVALEILPDMPECYMLHDGVCVYGGVSTGHRATSEWFGIAGSTLYTRLKAMPGLPDEIAEVVGSIEAETFRHNRRQEYQTRAKLIRALLDSGKPQQPNGDGEDKPQSQENVEGEPSWAALGHLIKELSFVQVMRRAYFENRSLGMSAAQFIQLSAPLVDGHPYAAYIETFVLDQAAKLAAWENLQITHPEDLERQQYKMYRMYYWHYHPDKKKRKRLLNKIVSTQVDLTAHDMSLELEQLDRPNQETFVYERSVFCLMVISPFSPYARAIAVMKFGDRFADKLPEWEKTADQNSRLCVGLARRYASKKRWEESAKWARTAFDLCPTKNVALLLGRAYWRQGKKDLWIGALEECLNYPDYGLNHARICKYIAQYHMRHKDWEAAAKYAGSAAETYSAWGLNVMADCHEGMQEWDEAEKLRKASSIRYRTGALGWYWFCRRTGHGDLEAARAVALPLVESKDYKKNSPLMAAAFYKLEKKPEEVAKILSEHFSSNPGFIHAMHFVLLFDELKNVKARDEVIEYLITPGFKASKMYPQESIDAVIGLAKMIDVDLKAGGKGEIDLVEADRLREAMAKKLDAPPDSHSVLPVTYNYFIGRYLGLHGQPEGAVKYYKKCLADTEYFDILPRTFAGAKLCELGIKPESYKALWEKPKENEKE